MAFWNKDFTKNKTFRKTMTALRKTKIHRDTVPLFHVFRTLILKLSKTNVHQQASSIAFSFMLSLFPAILFLFSLVPFVAANIHMPGVDITQSVLDLVKELVPPGIFDFIDDTIEDIIENPRGGLLSFGFLFALYASSSGVVDLMHTFNTNFEYSEKRSFIKKRLIALGLAFLFALMMVFAVIIIPVAELVFHLFVEYKMMSEDTLFWIFGLLRYLLAFSIFYVGISVVYYIAPAVSNHWRFFSLGSTIAAVLVIVITQGFSFYLSNFANYNKLYGSIGTIIALMLWFYLLAWVLLLGFALNASTLEAKVAYEKEMEKRLDLLDDFEGEEPED